MLQKLYTAALGLIMICTIVTGIYRSSYAQKDLLVRNGTVLTGTGQTIEKGSILIRSGKIAQIGTNIQAPAGVPTIDATGLYVMAGIIDAHSHLAQVGTNEGTSQNSAMVDISDVIRPDDYGIYLALGGGVTAMHVLHGSANVIGGKDDAVKLKWGRSKEEMLIPDNPEGLKFALGENPIGGDTRYPNSRMGQEYVLRSYLEQAKQYKLEWDTYEAKVAGKIPPANEYEKKYGPVPPRKDLQLETLKGVLEGKVRTHIHGYMNQEMAMVINVFADYGITPTSFEHCMETYMIADELAKTKTVASLFVDSWNFKVEASRAIPFTAALLTERGAIANIHSDSGERIRRLNLDAAKTIRYGDTMTETDAIKTITLNAAIYLKLQHRMGTIEVGKDGDLSIWDAHPLSVYSKCVKTIIDGEVFFDRDKAITTDKWLKGIK